MPRTADSGHGMHVVNRPSNTSRQIIPEMPRAPVGRRGRSEIQSRAVGSGVPFGIELPYRRTPFAQALKILAAVQERGITSVGIPGHRGHQYGVIHCDSLTRIAKVKRQMEGEDPLNRDIAEGILYGTARYKRGKRNELFILTPDARDSKRLKLVRDPNPPLYDPKKEDAIHQRKRK